MRREQAGVAALYYPLGTEPQRRSRPRDVWVWVCGVGLGEVGYSMGREVMRGTRREESGRR